MDEEHKNPIDYLQSSKYPKMFRLIFDDGTISNNFFNKARARDAVIQYDRWLKKQREKAE
jgi:hypothetical protein